MADFERNEVEHTFSSGRTFIIRRHIPIAVLLYKAIEDGDEDLAAGLTEWVEGSGELTPADDSPEARMSSMKLAGKITRTVLEAMFVEPKVAWHSEGGLPAGFIAVEDLHDSEMNEVVELAMESVREAARFPDEEAGNNGGGSRKDVEQKPKRPARAKPRKS